MMKLFLGNDETKSPMFWSPKKEKNPHFMVVGTSGSGKTETLKAIIHELHNYKVPSLIIDFHQDFEDVDGTILDFNNLTINPLEYGAETPENVMYKVSHILKKIFRLGVQQEGALQNAVQKSYENNGINIKSTAEGKAPTFEDVKAVLEEMLDGEDEKISAHTVETLLVRLRPLFNTGFFTDKKSTVPFAQIFKRTTVLKLKNMPTEEVKYAIAEFFINKLKYELYARGKTSELVLYCIVDEAHRLIDERSPLNDLLRESRKYGTGVILSSQRPSDFSETVLANVGGILALQCRLDKDAMFVAKQLGMNFGDIKNLTQVGTGYINFSSEEKTRKVKIIPEWERTKKEKPKTKKVEEKKHDTEKEIKPKPVIQKDIEKDDDGKITVLDEYRYSPPLSWLVYGSRTLFSDPKVGALFTVAMIVSLPALGYIYWAGLLAMVVTFVTAVGKLRKRNK